MAPEVFLAYGAKSRKEDIPFNPFQADVYSFGMVIFQLVGTPLHCDRKYLEGNSFQHLIEVCLNEDPTKRPTTSQLLEMFHEIQTKQ